jgi:ubiquinone/menaquinone biosynthesis C-methylase UbiE
LVEVGCGSAKAAAFSINPTDYEYDYIGVEPSWQRLLHARAILPSGNFIQGSALNLPIQSAQARAILAFGALHHMPDPLVALREMIRVLSDGGYLGFHEPIRTPKILSATSKMAARIKRAFETYEHSEHDNDIDYMKVRKLLKENGFEILNEVFCNSIFGYLLQRAVRRVPLIGRARATAWAIQQLDHGWVKTIGAISERFGARAVVHLSQAR